MRARAERRATGELRPVLEAMGARQRAVAERLADAFAAGGREIYLVGGIVRDPLLGRPVPSDLDLATSASPEETRRLGKAAGADEVFAVGERFGTIGFVFGRNAERLTVEITTFRRDAYPDETRFPTVELGGSLEEDLARRDFTVNAIAADPATGTLIDPFGGQADLALGVLRAVGDPDARYAEDPLRLLRAARFVAQLGFRLDPDTEAAMARNAPSLGRISQERILAELSKLLVGDYAPHGLDALRRTGLLTVAMPELAPMAAEADQGSTLPPHGPSHPHSHSHSHSHREKELWEHTTRVVGQAPPRVAVRWAALLHDAAKPLTRGVDASGEVHFFGHERVGADLTGRLLRRLKADKALHTTVRRLVELHGRSATYEPDWTDSAVRRLALEAGEVWDDLLDLAAADVTSARAEKQAAAAARVAGLRAHFERLRAEADLATLQSPLDGDALMAIFDRGPGIWIKRVKDALRELVIDGDLAPDDAAGAERIARGMIERGEADEVPTVR